MRLLEHFEDTRKAMRIVDGLLASGGIVALRTPNAHCLRTMLCGFHSWNMISPPEHYRLFTRQSLKFFLRQCGYRVIHLATVHSDWIYYRRISRLLQLPFHLSGALGLGGDLVAVAERNS